MGFNGFGNRRSVECNALPMTRESSWRVTGTTLTLLRQIEALGYIVSVHRLQSSMRGKIPARVELGHV